MATEPTKAEIPAANSSRQILRSTGIIGGSSAANVAIGLVRTKVAALILGPAGIGLIGILHNLMTVAAGLACWGISNAGTRQIAAAADDEPAAAAARRAVAFATMALALAGGILMFLAREPIARLVLGGPQWAGTVGWLALGTALMVSAYGQNGLLTGLRRVGDLARVSVYSALAAAVAGIAALLAWREDGLLLFVLVSPVATLLVGLYYVSRLPRPASRPPIGLLIPQWRKLATLGAAFTVAAVMVTAGQLAVRSLVQQRLGPEALGYFQASWVISANYIGFILTAMAAEYYPRLTSVIGDQAAARSSVNQQVEFGLLLGGPIIVGAVALGPWLIPLLFSSEFLPALEVLRWQIAGDVLKIATWPIGVVLLASGRGVAFATVEALASASFVLATWLLLPHLGLTAPGVGYLIMYMVYLPLQLLMARRIIGFRPAAASLAAFGLVALALSVTVAVSFASDIAGAAVGVLLAAALGVRTLLRLENALPYWAAALVGRARRSLESRR